MDVRIWALAAVVLFIGGFSAFTGQFSKLDTAQHELAEAKAELKELEEQIADDEASAEETKAEAEKVKQLVPEYVALETQKKPLVDAILALEGQKEATLKVFREAVAEVRSKSVGIEWADVPFRNGQILRQVRLQKVTETEITLAHSDGVAKLNAEELPADLRARFRVGMEPFLSLTSAQQTPATVATAPGSTPATGTKTSALSSKSTQPSPVDPMGAAAAVVTQIENELLSQYNKIKEAEKVWYKWRDQAVTYREQAAGAKSMGRPTYNFVTQATEAQKQASVHEAQVNRLRTEQTSMQERLTKARAAHVKAVADERARMRAEAKAEAEAKAKARAEERAARAAKND